jgi:hypothetical protein
MAIGLGLGTPFRAGAQGGPALPSQIMQALKGLDSGLVIHDKKDIVNPEPEVRDVNCLEFDQTQDVTMPKLIILNFSEPWIITFLVKPVAIQNAGWLVTTGSNLGRLSQAGAGNMTIHADDANQYSFGGNPSIVPINVWSVVTVGNDGAGTGTLTITDQANTTTTFPTTGTFSFDSIGGQHFGSSWKPFEGRMAFVSVNTGEFNFPFAENGLPKDVSGKGNHATSLTATPVQDDGIPSHNQEFGHTPAVVGDKTGYIDTGVVPDDDTIVEDVIEFAPYAVSALLHGAFDNPYRHFYGRSSDTTLQFAWGSYNQSAAGINYDGPMTVRTEAAKMYLNGVEILDGSSGGSIDAMTRSLFMFARNNGSADLATADIIYSRKIWQSGELIRDMVPIPDGGFLDKVNNVIYSNDGAGTIVTKYSPALEVPTVSIGTFDGVGDKVTPQTDFLFTGDFTARIVFELDFDDVGGQYRLIADTSLKGLIINGGQLTFFDGGFNALPTIVVTNTEYTATVRRVGTTLYMAMDDDPETEFLGSTGAPTPLFCSVGGLSSTADKRLKIYEASGQDSLTGFDYDLTEYNGKTTTIITDNSGNGNDGTVSTGAGGLDSFWGAREVMRIRANKDILSAGVNSRLTTGQTLASNGDLYSASVPGVSYTRNPDFWAADVDISCMDVWFTNTASSGTGPTWRRLTMVTPRHGVFADHFGGTTIGDTYGFVGADNVYHTRTIQAYETEIGDSDIRVVLLDSDLPASIIPCKVAPSNLSDFIEVDNVSIGYYIPTLATNQFDQGTVQTWSYIDALQKATYVVPVEADQLAMYTIPVDKDSGNPSFFIHDGEAVLLSHWTGTTGGPAYPDYIGEVNTQILAVDAAEGISTGYTVTEANFNPASGEGEIVDAAAYLPIVCVGGKLQNRSEVTVQQTAADETVFGGATIWGNGTDTWDKLTFQELYDQWFRNNGSTNSWIQVKDTYIELADQYPTDLVLTSSQVSKNHRYYGGGTWVILEGDEGNTMEDDVGNEMGYYL